MANGEAPRGEHKNKGLLAAVVASADLDILGREIV